MLWPFRRATLLPDVVEVLLVDPPQLKLLDHTTFQKHILYSSVGGIDRPPHLCQLGSVDRTTIFCEIVTENSFALACRNPLTSRRNLLIFSSAFLGFVTMHRILVPLCDIAGG